MKLEILRVENVKGDYSKLEKSPGSSPEIYAYGLFTKLDEESKLGKCVNLQQESPLFSMEKDLARHIKENFAGEDITTIINKHNKAYISGSDRNVFVSKDQSSVYSAYVQTLTFPQYANIKEIVRELKQE
ncbi:hypothetical protein HOK51_11480 [Candidatus Woesearchaeota archaeon]|jgi:hypothetical protein|nr:hypothetical protein [Candidatus Woesearchaeota archaeon]MBT6520443.1 hypothetical protein [Candidatus Woesearchaeota archaeon]MBT7367337.1 hypothetical protein [Candidatus Woesearchaeota archaeon]